METPKEEQEETGEDACEDTQKGRVSADTGGHTKRGHLKRNVKRCIWRNKMEESRGRGHCGEHAWRCALGLRCSMPDEGPLKGL